MGLTINQGQLYEIVSQPLHQKYLYQLGSSASSSSSSSGSQAPAPAAAAAAQAAQPASPTANASSLQIMLAGIRPAQDGQVITAEDHNALRLAMVAIANHLGLGTVSEEVTVTLVPSLQPALKDDGAAAVTWDSDYGVAFKTATAAGVLRGWMEVDLPDGARIKKIVAYGTIAGGGELKVRLIRQKVTTPTDRVILAESTITSTTVMSTGVEADVTLPQSNLGPNAIEESRIVNNREQKYLLSAEVAAMVSGTNVKFASAQIVCGR